MAYINTILHYFSPILGLCGTWLIFLYGIPRKIDTGGRAGRIVAGSPDNKEVKDIEKYKLLGNLGLVLIILSYLLSLVSLGIDDYLQLK